MYRGGIIIEGGIKRRCCALLMLVLLAGAGCVSRRGYNYEIVKKALKQGKKKDRIVSLKKELVEPRKPAGSRKLNQQFLEAAIKDDTALLLRLIGAGADVNASDAQGWTALIWSVYNGSAEAARILIAGGADAGIADNDSRTPLMWAAFENNGALIELLLSANAVLNSKDSKGWTALLYAFNNASGEVVDTLINNGADFEAVLGTELGELLLISAKKDSAVMAGLLIAKGADVNYANRAGGTALIYAAAGGGVATAKKLIESGCDVNAADRDGWTALKYAQSNNNKEIAELLKNSKAAE